MATWLPVAAAIGEAPRQSPLWSSYEALPVAVQELADRTYEQLKTDLRHPSLHLKRIGRFWSVRVGLRHRALAVQASEDELIWVWIGTHAQYDQLLKKG